MSDSPHKEITITTSARPNGMCEVAVQDSGPGVSDQMRENLFTPFMSTKTGGLGIGLSISRTIVEAHGGQIWCETGQQRGTIFRFTLPRG